MSSQHWPRFLQIVDDAKKRVRETSIEDVKAKMDRDKKFSCRWTYVKKTS